MHAGLTTVVGKDVGGRTSGRKRVWPHEHREHADGAVSQRVEHVGSMVHGHSLVRMAANAF